MRHLRFTPPLHEEMRSGKWSAEDRQQLIMALLDLAKNGERKRTGQSYSTIPELDDVPCRCLHIPIGRKRIGLIAITNDTILSDKLLILYVKEAAPGNLSMQERNIIRERYRTELEMHESTP